MAQRIVYILVVDTDGLTPVGLLDTYQTFEWHRKWQGVGTFTLHLDPTEFARSGLAQYRFLAPYFQGSAPSLLYIIEQVERETLDDGGEGITIQGREVAGYLDERIIYTDGTTYPTGYDSQSGVTAEAAMKHYVNLHAGPGAPVIRRLPGLALAADLGRGGTVSEQGRFQYIGEMLLSLAQRANLGWQVTWNPATGVQTFDVVPGVDRSATVIFDQAFDSARKLHYIQDSTKRKTWLLIAGQGELGSRNLVQRWTNEGLGASEPSGYARREGFKDERETNDTNILQQRGDAILIGSEPTEQLEGEVFRGGPFQYRVDFDLGDIVTLRSQKWNLSRPVRVVGVNGSVGGDSREAVIALDFDKAFPTIGDAIREAASAGSTVAELTTTSMGAVKKGGDTMTGGLGVAANDHQFRLYDANGATPNNPWDFSHETDTLFLRYFIPATSTYVEAWRALVTGEVDFVGPVHAGNARIENLASGLGARFADPNGDVYLAGKTNAYACTNAYYDGTNWNRYDTAQPAAVLSVLQNGNFQYLTKAAGANPILFWDTAGTITPAQFAKLATLPRGDMDVKAVYIGNVAAGTTVTAAHGWGDRPTSIQGWHDNGVGTGLYYYPFSAGVGLAGATDVVITYCDGTNVKVKAGASIAPYCWVAGVFPRSQQ